MLLDLEHDEPSELRYGYPQIGPYFEGQLPRVCDHFHPDALVVDSHRMPNGGTGLEIDCCLCGTYCELHPEIPFDPRIKAFVGNRDAYRRQERESLLNP